jgi:hypothetical protein
MEEAIRKIHNDIAEALACQIPKEITLRSFTEARISEEGKRKIKVIINEFNRALKNYQNVKVEKDEEN